MSNATAELAGDARSAIKRGQRRWSSRRRGDSHDWKGRHCWTVFLSDMKWDRGMSASHRPLEFSNPETEKKWLVAQLRDDREAVSIEESSLGGGPLLHLYVEQFLKWVIAAPGSPLISSHLDTWCWRLQHYDSSRECLLSLTEIEELAPAAASWSREAHCRAVEGLRWLQVEGVGDQVDEVAQLEVLITMLEAEMKVLELQSRSAEADVRNRKWIPSGLDFRRATVRWLYTPALAAGGDKTLLVGEERGGRFRVAFVAGAAEAEAEVDLKRSLVTIHRVEGQPPLLVAGETLETKLSLPVADDAMGENPPELRVGRQLGKELERVVCVG